MLLNNGSHCIVLSAGGSDLHVYSSDSERITGIHTTVCVGSP